MANEQGNVSRVNVFNLIQKYIIGIAAVVAVLMLILPMPKFLIDLSMILNLAFSVIILLIVVYTPRASNFTQFPRIILFATLFGLGINISSTRLILTHNPQTGMSDQSDMVQAFANIVTGGNNIVVGMVIFIILIVVQVVVITKGATRVSEVAARFSLDSMSNKFFDVDSRLNSGSITQEEADRQKSEIRREIDFYSAMDGSSKFVSGNVKAGIFITVINLVGGMIMYAIKSKGGFNFMDAIQTYSNLTIGDGLLSQIPSLMLSFATGLIVTGSTTDEPFDQKLKHEFSVSGNVYEIVGVTLAVMGVALRHGTQFLLLPIGALFFYIGYKMAAVQKIEKEKKAAADAAAKGKHQTGGGPSDTDTIAPLDPLSLELGYALIPLVDKEKGAELLERVTRIRHEIALDMGLIVPRIRIIDNMTLDPNEYSFKIRGIEAGRSKIRLGYYMCMNTGGVTEEIEGEKTKDPAFNMPAIWVTEENRAKAEQNGYAVVDPPTIIATHLTELIRRNAPEILGQQEVSALIDKVKETNPVVVDAVLTNDKCKFSYGDIEKVLRALLSEQVSIRNMVTILETLSNFGPITHDTWDLTEKVREALGLQICRQYSDADGKLRVMNLSQSLSQSLLDHAIRPPDGSKPVVAFDPVDGRRWIKYVSEAFSIMKEQSYQPVIMCSSIVRQLVKSSTEREIPGLVVISDKEILACGNNIAIEVLGEITEDKGEPVKNAQ